MEITQWSFTAATAAFVALVGYFQWRTAQQKAVLDLFDRRQAIYNVVRKAVGQMMSNSTEFDRGREAEFLESMERAYFFFGDDVTNYLNQLWSDIVIVRGADAELPASKDSAERGAILKRRLQSLERIGAFEKGGQPLFARYMRFSQTIPGGRWRSVLGF